MCVLCWVSLCVSWSFIYLAMAPRINLFSSEESQDDAPPRSACFHTLHAHTHTHTHTQPLVYPMISTEKRNLLRWSSQSTEARYHKSTVYSFIHSPHVSNVCMQCGVSTNSTLFYAGKKQAIDENNGRI